MRILFACLLVLIFSSVATAGPFPTDDDTPQPTMPPLGTPSKALMN
jgi:hypothetical protein